MFNIIASFKILNLLIKDLLLHWELNRDEMLLQLYIHNCCWLLDCGVMSQMEQLARIRTWDRENKGCYGTQWSALDKERYHHHDQYNTLFLAAEIIIMEKSNLFTKQKINNFPASDTFLLRLYWDQATLIERSQAVNKHQWIFFYSFFNINPWKKLN